MRLHRTTIIIALRTKSLQSIALENPACEVCIAAGDMFNMPGPRTIDVYVNSENDYMQMARIFESRTVSSLLRFYGSKLDEAGRIEEDTIQDELNQIIRKGRDPNTPGHARDGYRHKRRTPQLLLCENASRHATSFTRRPS